VDVISRLYRLANSERETHRTLFVKQLTNALKNSGFSTESYSLKTPPGCYKVFVVGKAAPKSGLTSIVRKTIADLGWYVHRVDDKVLTLLPILTHVVKPPRYLYHATTPKSLPSILNIGLVPQKGKRAAPHPPRIYLGTNPHEVCDQATFGAEYGTAAERSVVLRVDTRAFAPETLCYEDPDMNDDETSLFVVHPIPAAAIQKFRLSTKKR
jgi:hypothetical protein